jgi:hypothetical protein
MIDTSLQRVLFVNSGGFRLCDIDLSKSIHLYGGNNAGKTTIVNALQFAFIDNFKQMVWDGHKDDETKKHYFDLFSYIVFEVSTPTGPQCLALLGQGPGQSFGYQRWKYNGTLELEAYIAEDGDGKFKPRDNQFVKSYFAKMEAKGPLSGNEMKQWITGRGESPFSVAPLKRSNDFPKYKKVFTNLLRLEKLTSLEMRELLVACSDVVTNELNLRDKYENRYNEFLGKQNEILMINNARDTLESCIEDFDKLSEKRKSYSQQYNFAINFAEDEKRRLTLELGSLESAISESSKIDEEKKKQLEEITNQIDNQNQKLFDFDSKKKSLTEKINRGKGLVEIELRVQHASLTQKCERLASATQESRYSDLERQEKSLSKKIKSLESQLNGKSSLRMHIRNLLNNSPELFSIWDKILSGELMQLIEGDGFTIENENELLSLLNSLSTLSGKPSLNFGGASIDLGQIDSHSLPETTEQLEKTSQELSIRLDAVKRAIEAKKESRKIKLQLEDSRKKLNQCDDDIKLLNNMPDLILQLKEIEKTLTEIRSRRAKLNEERDKLSEERVVFRENIVRKEARSREIAQTVEKISNDLRSIHPPSDDWAETDSEKIEGEDWKDIFKIIDRLNSRCKEAYRKLQSSLELAHKVTDGRFRNVDLHSGISDMKTELESLQEKKEVNDRLQNSLIEGMKNDIRNFMTSYDAVIKKISSINRSFNKISISNLDWFKLVPSPNDTGIIAAMDKIREEDTILAFVERDNNSRGSLDVLFNKGRISIEDIFEVNVHISVGGEIKKYRDIGRFESQGTTIAVKVCFHVEILKNMMKSSIGRIPIFLDELEKLDDRNIQSIVDYIHDAGLSIITASPRPKTVIPLNYWLDRSGFVLERHKAVWGG